MVPSPENRNPPRPNASVESATIMMANPPTDSSHDSLQRPTRHSQFQERGLPALAASSRGVQVVSVCASLEEKWLRSVIPFNSTFRPITGVNAATVTALTDTTGHASLAYTGTVRGADTLQAAASAIGSVPSAILPVFWLNPANPITTTAAAAQFFAAT